MDASKTGAFIAQLRKEKGYTQKELADRIHVSDKAISRWETGKGFPETTLLKPLSDELGISISELLSGEQIPEETIKEKTDHVIVSSMQDSKKKLKGWKLVCVGLAVLIAVCLLFLFLPGNKEPSAIEFVNSSATYTHYPLGHKDNGVHYTEFIRNELESGYEYYLPDGTQRYVFSPVDGSSEPVLSYIHHSGEGMIFGFRIGDQTIINRNQDLGVEAKSLHMHLLEHGFDLGSNASDFGRPTLVYIDGERCNWYTYTKENVFINICISAHEGNKLMGYDIGMIDADLNGFFEKMLSGFPVLLEDPYHLVTGELQSTYCQWDPVTITVTENLAVDALYLYINGQLIDKFTDTITFEMYGAPITVLVTPKAPHEHSGTIFYSEETHRMDYQCGCPSPNAEHHSDADNDNACDICGYPVSFTNCPFEWIQSETGHYKTALCDCCQYSTTEFPHVNYDEDLLCDTCGYDLGKPASNMLRDQLGVHWLQEITADDIAQIEISRKAFGAAPNSLISISFSEDRNTILQFWEEYWQMTVTADSVSQKPSDTLDLITVTFFLKDGAERKLTLLNGVYFDAMGNGCQLRYIPFFREGSAFDSYYRFVTSQETCEIWYQNPYSDAYPNYDVCQIPLDEIKFIIVDSYTTPEGGFEEYEYLLHTEFGNHKFESLRIFNSGDYANGRPLFYKLIGLNLKELIEKYSDNP